MGDALLLFDIDGTLVDASVAQRVAWRAATARVLGAPRELADVDHHGVTARRLAELLAGAALPAATLAALLDAHASALRAWRHGHRPLPGVRAVLARLAGHRTLGVVTGNSAAAAAALLDGAGLAGWFTGGGYGEGVTDRSEVVAAALRASGITGRPAAVVGDTPRDVVAALANGCLAVGVATGAYPVDALRAAGAHLVLPDLDGAGAADALLDLHAGGR